MNKKLFTIIIALLIAVSAAVQAAEYGGSFLELGAGARALAMGSAQTAVANDAYAAYWNPAGLMNIKTMDCNAAYTSYFGLVNSKVINFSHVYEKGILAFGYASNWVDGIHNTVYTDNRPQLSGADFGYNSSVMMLSKADLFPKEWNLPGQKNAWGINIKFSGEGFSYRPGASAMSLDAGVQQKLCDQFSWGVAVQNLLKSNLEWNTPSKNLEQLPTILNLGVAYQLDPQLQWTMDLRFKDSRPFTYHTGAEYIITNARKNGVSYALRGGLNNGDLAFGLGLNYGGFKLDYAYAGSRDSNLDATHLISIGFGN
ncbi:MAG: type IX secretion system membrane protein PorP/SprF [Candidatus Margulisiibacteriota bacterium]|jgi:long-subunit fatty acid transport protein